MERWNGRVAVVTGASSGIGAELAKQLVQHGLRVVGIARRVELVEDIEKGLKGAPGKLYPYKADISSENEVLKAFLWIKKNLGAVDILINNAAANMPGTLTDVIPENIRQIFQCNILGMCMCTREAVKSMKERGVDGHVININGVTGHYLVNMSGIYANAAAKRAAVALTEGLRRELVQQKSKIKVSSVSPGLVDTELVRRYASDDSFLEHMPILQAKDIADAVLYILGTPPHVQIHELMIRPVGEMF